MNDRTMGLYRKIVSHYDSTPIFTTAAQAYDSVMLLAAAIEKAGTLEREQVRDALENIENVQGVIKVYEKPFSRVDHEALSEDDFHFAHWVNGSVVGYSDDVTEGLIIR
jgi:branched-chain amino acid transport system substrate-binding protein